MAPLPDMRDSRQPVVESSADGVTWSVASPSLVSSGQTAVSQFNDFRIGDPGTGYTPDNVAPGTLPAVIPFPATRTLRFSRGTATQVRLVLVGGNDSDTENLLFDNIKFAAIPPVHGARRPADGLRGRRDRQSRLMAQLRKLVHRQLRWEYFYQYARNPPRPQALSSP